MRAVGRVTRRVWEYSAAGTAVALCTAMAGGPKRRTLLAFGCTAAVCAWVLLLGGRIELVPRYVPAFVLREQDGTEVHSTDRIAGEVFEQEVLFDFLQPGDRVVNLGGAKGTSCIFIEKIVGRGATETSLPSADPHTLCVEPNTGLLETLNRNFESNGVSDIRILSGMFSSKESCPQGLPVVDSVGSEQVTGKTLIQQYGAATFEIKRCFSLEYMQSIFQGQGPTVLFADCEGCLPPVIKDHPSMLHDPKLRLVVFERDGDPSGSNYGEAEDALAAAGFSSPQRGAWVSAWKRGSTVTLRVWCIPVWILTLAGLTAGCDWACAAILPVRAQSPVLRCAVLMVWYRLLRALTSLGLATTFGGLLRPIVGWQPVRWTSFVISNFLFMYACIIWPLAEEAAPKAPRRAIMFFCAMVMVPVIIIQVIQPCENWSSKEQRLWQLTIVASVIMAAHNKRQVI